MEIKLLLTILFIVISLGGLFFYEGKICFIKGVLINDSIAINLNIKKGISYWTEKFVMREVYLLNTVALLNCQIGIQTALIQHQNPKFEG